MKEFDRFLDVVRALQAERVDYVVFGGAAVNVHGLVRATEDIDLMIRGDRENVERLKRALHRVWDDPEIELISADDLLGDYPSVRYGPPEETLYLDILTRLGELYSFENIEAEDIELRGVKIHVATARALFRMKRNTVRPRDHVDAMALQERFELDDE